MPPSAVPLRPGPRRPRLRLLGELLLGLLLGATGGWLAGLLRIRRP